MKSVDAVMNHRGEVNIYSDPDAGGRVDAFNVIVRLKDEDGDVISTVEDRVVFENYPWDSLVSRLKQDVCK